MRSGVPCYRWHMVHICSNLRQVTSPLDAHSLLQHGGGTCLTKMLPPPSMDFAKCVTGTIDRIALQARPKTHAIEILCIFSKYYSAFPLLTSFWCCLHVPEGCRVEVSREIKKLLGKMFGKDVFLSYLAAGSHTIGFSICMLPQGTCKKIWWPNSTIPC